MPHIVAIAGPPGSGKSSLARALTTLVLDSTTLHFDSYERLTEQPVQRIVQLMRDGAALDGFGLPELARDLGLLKSGQAVVEPQSGHRVEPRKYVFFEMPLGKQHAPTARHLDLLIWIDTPLDLALARKVKELTTNFLADSSPGASREALAWLDGYLDSYVTHVRGLLEHQQAHVRPQADILVEGRETLENTVRETARQIQDRLP